MTGCGETGARIERHLRQAGPVERADLTLSLWAMRLGRKTPAKRLSALAELTDQPPLIAAGVLTVLFGGIKGDERIVRTGARMLAAFFAATAMKDLGKRTFSRTRPLRFAEEGRHDFTLFGPHDHEHDTFPSGHMAGSVAAAKALGREYPGLERPALLAALSITVLKVTKGDHFPGDLLAGWPIGLAGERATSRLFAARRRSGAGAPTNRPSSAGGGRLARQ